MQFVNSQAASRIVLDTGRVITKCDTCREMWAERNQRGVEGSPNCDECKVELLPENSIAADIYRRVRGQVRLYFNGEYTKEIDLDHNAVWAMIDHYPQRIDDPWDVFIKVMSTYQELRSKDDGEQS